MSKINLSNQLLFGMSKDGEVLYRVPSNSSLNVDRIYRMIYEIMNIKGENPYSTRVDLTFSGNEIMSSLLKTFDRFMGSYTGPSSEQNFHFRHFCKWGMLIYSYVKIKGHTPSVRKYLKSLNPDMSTKVQKQVLGDKDWLMDLVKSYTYLHLKDVFNTIHIKDTE